MSGPKQNKTNGGGFVLPTESIVPTVQTPRPQQLSIEQAMSLAAQHQQAGKLQQSEGVLRQVLGAQPNHPPALHLLGVVAHMSGQTKLAVDLIGQAIKGDDNIALFHSNRGEMYRILERTKEAVKHGERAVKLDSASVSAQANLGIAYFDAKEFDKAEACQKKALALEPNFAPSLNNMGSILREKKDNDAACEFYYKALDAQPGYLEPLNNLGATLSRMDKPDEALECLDKVLTQNPHYAEAHSNRGYALLSLSREAESLAAFTTALQIKADHAQSYAGLARVYLEMHNLDKAEEAILKARKLDPELPEIHSVMGSVLMSSGRPDRAKQSFKKALKLDADCTSAKLGMGNLYLEEGRLDEAEALFRGTLEESTDKLAALFSLIQAKKNKKGDPEIALLEKEAEKLDSLPVSKKINIHYGLGKVYDDTKEYEKGFEHFIEGARLKRTQLDYSRSAQDQTMRRIKEVFSAERMDMLRGNGKNGSSSKLPIFVLGMPRSGTTLTEQIISSHPDVLGAGELFELLDLTNAKGESGPLIYPESMKDLKAGDLKGLGDKYAKGLQKYGPKAKRITDKMPANFHNVGLINLILPKAKIVHIQRNPLDTCISCFTRLFAHGQNQSYDLAELGHYYRNYKHLMDYWRETLPKGSFYDVRYEDIVEDTEGQARSLLEYCGLEWDERCLDFHKNKRSIRTASVTQVRQPIYKSSLERWKRYEKFLAPLIDELGDVL